MATGDLHQVVAGRVKVIKTASVAPDRLRRAGSDGMGLKDFSDLTLIPSSG